ncbi:MAG: TetR/AcrR family transcriptional regulator C-terminal domain-containing protein [Gammaproteobacteria bacterium]|nr:TetR/AcrR family transcriptional regulator C-terminal domain-containing protein [Gammaproteobacteria bacterium]
MATRVVRGIELGALEEVADWRERLRLWARAVRSRQLEFASTVAMAQISPHIPASWFEVTAPLLRALEMAGLSGKALIDTARCFSRIVYGSILTELAQDPLPVAVRARRGRRRPRAPDAVRCRAGRGDPALPRGAGQRRAVRDDHRLCVARHCRGTAATGVSTAVVDPRLRLTMRRVRYLPDAIS